ncbi:hypothetical protein L1077_24440 [Pseudoalteromonas luteoviolacea]|uniref:hypothetical protein n=1 Tax=Pseudoalteromonas luteoviolacea TaxID=43657 RepID=UPI001F254D6C|nr:hypothetical protein [Pseudoalteromonas luteoviolacea]MCF6442574.1 hypothetical protein [Pseudoalteromonas luteoviolacea]
MKLKINKKAIKSLSNDSKAIPVMQTPNIAGGNNPFPYTVFEKGCRWFTHMQVHTCNNPY